MQRRQFLQRERSHLIRPGVDRLERQWERGPMGWDPHMQPPWNSDHVMQDRNESYRRRQQNVDLRPLDQNFHSSSNPVRAQETPSYSMNFDRNPDRMQVSPPGRRDFDLRSPPHSPYGQSQVSSHMTFSSNRGRYGMRGFGGGTVKRGHFRGGVSKAHRNTSPVKSTKMQKDTESIKSNSDKEARINLNESSSSKSLPKMKNAQSTQSENTEVPCMSAKGTDMLVQSKQTVCPSSAVKKTTHADTVISTRSLSDVKNKGTSKSQDSGIPDAVGSNMKALSMCGKVSKTVLGSGGVSLSSKIESKIDQIVTKTTVTGDVSQKSTHIVAPIVENLSIKTKPKSGTALQKQSLVGQNMSQFENKTIDQIRESQANTETLERQGSIDTVYITTSLEGDSFLRKQQKVEAAKSSPAVPKAWLTRSESATNNTKASKNAMSVFCNKPMEATTNNQLINASPTTCSKLSVPTSSPKRKIPARSATSMQRTPSKAMPKPKVNASPIQTVIGGKTSPLCTNFSPKINLTNASPIATVIQGKTVSHQKVVRPPNPLSTTNHQTVPTCKAQFGNGPRNVSPRQASPSHFSPFQNSPGQVFPRKTSPFSGSSAHMNSPAVTSNQSSPNVTVPASPEHFQAPSASGAMPPHTNQENMITFPPDLTSMPPPLPSQSNFATFQTSPVHELPLQTGQASNIHFQPSSMDVVPHQAASFNLTPPFQTRSAVMVPHSPLNSALFHESSANMAIPQTSPGSASIVSYQVNQSNTHPAQFNPSSPHVAPFQTSPANAMPYQSTLSTASPVRNPDIMVNQTVAAPFEFIADVPFQNHQPIAERFPQPTNTGAVQAGWIPGVPFHANPSNPTTSFAPLSTNIAPFETSSIQTIPTQYIPMQGVPTQAVLTQRVLTQGVPSQGVPTQGVPSQGVPSQGVPLQPVSIQGVPSQAVLTQRVPTQGVLTQGVPSQGVPLQPVSTQGVPSQAVLTQRVPTQGVLTQGVPSQGVPLQPVSTQGVPSQAVLTQRVPTQGVLTQRVPSQGVPLQPVSTQGVPTQPLPTNVYAHMFQTGSNITPPQNNFSSVAPFQTTQANMPPFHFPVDTANINQTNIVPLQPSAPIIAPFQAGQQGQGLGIAVTSSPVHISTNLDLKYLPANGTNISKQPIHMPFVASSLEQSKGEGIEEKITKTDSLDAFRKQPSSVDTHSEAHSESQHQFLKSMPEIVQKDRQSLQDPENTVVMREGSDRRDEATGAARSEKTAGPDKRSSEMSELRKALDKLSVKLQEKINQRKESLDEEKSQEQINDLLNLNKKLTLKCLTDSSKSDKRQTFTVSTKAPMSDASTSEPRKLCSSVVEKAPRELENLLLRYGIKSTPERILASAEHTEAGESTGDCTGTSTVEKGGAQKCTSTGSTGEVTKQRNDQPSEDDSDDLHKSTRDDAASKSYHVDIEAISRILPLVTQLNFENTESIEWRRTANIENEKGNTVDDHCKTRNNGNKEGKVVDDNEARDKTEEEKQIANEGDAHEGLLNDKESVGNTEDKCETNSEANGSGSVVDKIGDIIDLTELDDTADDIVDAGDESCEIVACYKKSHKTRPRTLELEPFTLDSSTDDDSDLPVKQEQSATHTNTPQIVEKTLPVGEPILSPDSESSAVDRILPNADPILSPDIQPELIASIVPEAIPTSTPVRELDEIQPILPEPVPISSPDPAPEVIRPKVIEISLPEAEPILSPNREPIVMGRTLPDAEPIFSPDTEDSSCSDRSVLRIEPIVLSDSEYENSDAIDSQDDDCVIISEEIISNQDEDSLTDTLCLDSMHVESFSINLDPVGSESRLFRSNQNSTRDVRSNEESSSRNSPSNLTVQDPAKNRCIDGAASPKQTAVNSPSHQIEAEQTSQHSSDKTTANEQTSVVLPALMANKELDDDCVVQRNDCVTLEQHEVASLSPGAKQTGTSEVKDATDELVRQDAIVLQSPDNDTEESDSHSYQSYKSDENNESGMTSRIVYPDVEESDIDNSADGVNTETAESVTSQIEKCDVEQTEMGNSAHIANNEMADSVKSQLDKCDEEETNRTLEETEPRSPLSEQNKNNEAISGPVNDCADLDKETAMASAVVEALQSAGDSSSDIESFEDAASNQSLYNPKQYFADSFLEDSQRSAEGREESEEDDDDDYLLGADSFVSKLRTLRVQPKRLVQSQLNVSREVRSPTDSSSALSEAAFPAFQSGDPESTIQEKYCLDNLLLDKQNRDDLAQKLARIENDKVQLSAGKEVEVDLSVDQQLFLRKYEVQKQVIMKTHPGESVFNADMFGQLFTYPETLTLQSCGFVIGHTYLEKQLAAAPINIAVDMLTQGLFEMCLPNFTDPRPVLTWALYVMSLHGSSMVVHKCYHLLLSGLRTMDWVPTIMDFMRIFVNYGADLSHIGINVKAEHLTLASSHQQQQPAPRPPAQYRIENLDHVIKILTETVLHRYERFSSEELTTLSTLVCWIALDTRLAVGHVTFDTQGCLSVLLNAVTEVEWPSVLRRLCVRLAHLTSHHHNKVHLVEVFPSVPRGVLLKRALALVMLKQLLTHRHSEAGHNNLDSNKIEELAKEVATPKVQHTIDVLRGYSLKDLTAFYLTSSIVKLIDLSISNEILKAKEKADLQLLIDRVDGLRSDIRESMSVLDRTVIKDKIARLASKWRFMIQDMGLSQSTLHSWIESASKRPPPEITPGTVVTTATDAATAAAQVNSGKQTQQIEPMEVTT